MPRATKHTEHCVRKTELDYHSSTPVQKSIQYEHYQDVTAEPFNSHSGPVEFNVVGTSNEYIDLAKSYIAFEVQIKTSHGSAIDQSTELMGKYLSVINNLFHSLFSNKMSC